MPEQPSTSPTPAAPSPTPAAPSPTPAAPSPTPAAFKPKVGDQVTLAETNDKTKQTIQYLFLITEVGTRQIAAVDKDGHTIFEDVELPVDNGRTVKRRLPKTQKTPVYGGFAFNAHQQAPSPRLDVPITVLSPLS
jgi:hypothetical protein